MGKQFWFWESWTQKGRKNINQSLTCSSILYLLLQKASAVVLTIIVKNGLEENILKGIKQNLPLFIKTFDVPVAAMCMVRWVWFYLLIDMFNGWYYEIWWGK